MTEQVSFVIESIEKHRMSKKHGETEFYIKWQGYGPEENTWESNLEEDGMGAVIEEYLHAAGEEKARKKKEKRTKATPKKKSTRAKTPRRQASSGRKTSSTRKKKTPTKKAPSNSTKKNKNKKSRTKTPSRSASEKKKKKKKSSAKKHTQFADPVSEEHEVTSSSDTSDYTTHHACLGMTDGYLWWGCYAVAMCLFLVMSYLEINCSHHDLATSDICQADFVKWVHGTKMFASMLPGLLALWGITQLSANDSPLARFVAAGFVWMVASQVLEVLPQLSSLSNTDVWHASLLEVLSIAAGVVSQVFFVFAFGQKQYELAKEPEWSPLRAVPFAIIAYFIISEEFKEGRALRSAYDIRNEDPLRFFLLFGTVVTTCVAGWRAASRLGYGGIGWRSRRATKQILGVVGALSMAFALMIEFQGRPVLGWTILEHSLIRTMYSRVAVFVGVGMYAASAIMHNNDA
eukprot:g4654.t1